MLMYRTVVIKTPKSMTQISTKYYSAIYKYLLEHGCNHDTALNVTNWVQVAFVGEGYKLDGFEIYIVD